MKRIINRCIKTVWSVAIRKKEYDCFSDKWEQQRFTVVRNGLFSWMADPFIIDVKGKTYLFVERFSLFKNKGEIWCALVKNINHLSFKKVIECDKHMSFPMVFKIGDEIYLMPECSADGALKMYKAINFPFMWSEGETVFEKPVVDTIIINYGNDKYFCYSNLNNEGGSNNLEFSKSNVEKWDSRIVYSNNELYSRNGGKILKISDNMYRVAQNCAQTYGGSLQFMKILNPSYDSFDETPFYELLPTKVKLNKKIDIFGVHTYNSSEQYEVIDVKHKERKLLYCVIKAIRKIFKK